MSDAVGIRLDKDFLEKIDRLSKEEVTDRSTIIRKLAYAGYKDLIKKKAAEKYVQGKITLSEAAKTAETTIWEMEQYLIEQGYKSEYTIDDLRKEASSIH